MKLLLDTHTFLWFVSDLPQLSASAKALVEDPANQKFVSVASCWEIAIKAGVGKLKLAEPAATFLPREIATNLFDLLPIHLDHAAGVEALPHHHRDPFDRLLISQALIEALPVVSVDAAFDAYGVTRLWYSGPFFWATTPSVGSSVSAHFLSGLNSPPLVSRVA